MSSSEISTRQNTARKRADGCRLFLGDQFCCRSFIELIRVIRAEKFYVCENETCSDTLFTYRAHVYLLYVGCVRGGDGRNIGGGDRDVGDSVARFAVFVQTN